MAPNVKISPYLSPIHFAPQAHVTGSINMQHIHTFKKVFAFLYVLI